MYSLRQLFESQGGDLDVLDYPKFAKETFGITQIDVWSGAFPQEGRSDPKYYRELKRRADAIGSNFFLLMTGTVKCDAPNLEKQAAIFDQQVDFAELLGAKYVRVFLAAPKKMERANALKRSAAAMKPIADYALSKGIIIVIEPAPKQYSGDGRFLAELAKQMNHDSLRLMPDFGKMKKTTPTNRLKNLNKRIEQSST